MSSSSSKSLSMLLVVFLFLVEHVATFTTLPAVPRSALTSTQRFMFDWFNKPSETKDETKKEDEDTNMFSNFFNQASPPSTKDEETTASSTQEQKEAVEDKVEEIVAETAEAVTPATTMAGKEEASSSSLPETTAAAQEEGKHEIHFGHVRWFDRNKGFGFITPADGSKDIFVHQSEIQAPGYRRLFDGEPVEYGVIEEPKGPKAFHVTGPGGGDVLVTKKRRETAENGNKE